MDHFGSLVVLIGVIVVSVFFKEINARFKMGRMEFEIKADRKGDKKEKPGQHPDSSPNKPLE